MSEKRRVLKTKLLFHTNRKLYQSYHMEWYYVWWSWLTSKCAERVCQHQLSFMLLLYCSCYCACDYYAVDCSIFPLWLLIKKHLLNQDVTRCCNRNPCSVSALLKVLSIWPDDAIRSKQLGIQVRGQMDPPPSQLRYVCIQQCYTRVASGRCYMNNAACINVAARWYSTWVWLSPTNNRKHLTRLYT